MSKKTIKLKAYSDIQNEYNAAGTIKPGSLVILNANNQVVVNPAAGAAVATIFALEDELQGKTIRQDYATNDPVQTWYTQSGEEVLALVGSSVDPDIGDLMEAATGGNLRIHDEGEALFQVVSEKFVDDDDNHRIAVRRL